MSKNYNSIVFTVQYADDIESTIGFPVSFDNLTAGELAFFVACLKELSEHSKVPKGCDQTDVYNLGGKYPERYTCGKEGYRCPMCRSHMTFQLIHDDRFPDYQGGDD